MKIILELQPKICHDPAGENKVQENAFLESPRHSISVILRAVVKGTASPANKLKCLKFMMCLAFLTLLESHLYMARAH
jgi:hypothetical protein